MPETNHNLKVTHRSAFILGFFIFLGLAFLGYFMGTSAIKFKEYERSVTVKGLSQKELPADIVLWPIQFERADNNLETLYLTLEKDRGHIFRFLTSNGIDKKEISISPPSVVDKLAQQYGGNYKAPFRYSGYQVVTVYSTQVKTVRETINKLAELGKKGIVFKSDDYRHNTEYIFTRLNDIKPEMIEEATNKARQVADKFAEDSASKLGKIKKARQGQFSIRDRDKNNPHIKVIRVVSTVEYYLTD
ncbi:MAG: SIMPL domain-containing protein [Desulfobacula sp.]|uniref:SIMPL domain-containing protein n=1 Tax=Desulfobacula sp. TaxID=2593537 RepID=UPI0025C653C2|nr:SIMPL domain-containing protein [Desulfobacula sp.]MCD4721341.1 SIMPL domain-containing protein [Desulfobacula sp.]